MNENYKNENECKTNMDMKNYNTKMMVCPICEREFSDVRSYANHLMEHSDEQERKEAEERAKKKSDERKAFVEKLVSLRAKAKAAENEYNAAMAEYEEKYGNRTFGGYAIPHDFFNIFFGI